MRPAATQGRSVRRAAIARVGRRACCLAFAAVLGASCAAGRRVRGEIDTVERTIEVARASGAETCAPVDLARAVAHSEFAALELDEGDYYSARAELDVAARSAGQALRLSPRGRCAAAATTGAADRDGDGVPDDRDECMAQPEDRDGAQDDDGCPESDNDSDGLADAVDRCPDDAEDNDAFDDDDGCPEADNDRDGLVDRIDQCPDKAEDPDNFDDDDGCPDCDDDGDTVPECPRRADSCPGRAGRPPDGCPFKGVMVGDSRILLGEPVRFVGAAAIRPTSYELLDEVARVLEANPRLRVRVEAHTAGTGPPRRNLRTSQLRAAAVKRYLVARGISANRITSAGYGGTRPIAENTTPRGRWQNRRVEFVITAR
jgi:OmpA-OmpF porin, OOP family